MNRLKHSRLNGYRSWHLASVSIFAACIGCTQAQVENEERGSSVANTYSAQLNVAVDQDKLFSLTTDDIDAFNDELILSGQQGMQIAAPTMIDTDKHDHLPLLWLSCTSQQRNWEVSDRQNSAVIVSDLNSGLAEVVNAFPSSKKRDPSGIAYSRSGEPPKPEDAGDLSANTLELDVKSLSGMGWTKGRFSITLLNYDWRSNSEIVSLVSSTNQKVSEFKPGQRNPNTFEISEEENDIGKVSAVREINMSKTGDFSIRLPTAVAESTEKLSGSISLKLKAEIGKAVSLSKAGDASHKNNLKAMKLPITLVLAPLDQPYPFNITIIALLPGAEQLGGESFEIDFEINLSKLKETEPRMTKHPIQVYGVFWDQVIGPITLKVQ